MTPLETNTLTYWRAGCVINGQPTDVPPDYAMAVSALAMMAGHGDERIRERALSRMQAIDAKRTLVVMGNCRWHRSVDSGFVLEGV